MRLCSLPYLADFLTPPRCLTFRLLIVVSSTTPKGSVLQEPARRIQPSMSYVESKVTSGLGLKGLRVQGLRAGGLKGFRGFEFKVWVLGFKV